MITIKEVKNKKDIKDFIEFPLNLYKDCPYFVPPLYSSEKSLFKTNNIYCDQCESVYYNAYMDGKIVGRISGIIQKVANEKYNQKRVRFTRFDSIDDQEVANLLFSTVEKWAKEKGMTEIVGPLGFSDLEREGLLVEGFDQLSTFEEQYNYEYYKKLIENYGFIKEVGWTERKLYLPKEINPKLERISSMMMEKYHLKYVYPKTTKELINKYGDKIFDLLDKSYYEIYGSVPLNKKMRDDLKASFKLIVDVKFVAIIVDENDDVVCFGISFPSIAKAVQKSGGRLTPACIIRILKALRNPEILDLALIGVEKKYQLRGISSSIISNLLKYLSNCNIKYCETNLNLESNDNIQNQWKNFDSILHKKRSAFVKTIE